MRKSYHRLTLNDWEDINPRFAEAIRRDQSFLRAVQELDLAIDEVEQARLKRHAQFLAAVVRDQLPEDYTSDQFDTDLEEARVWLADPSGANYLQL